jgi:chromosome segregation ATPase
MKTFPMSCYASSKDREKAIFDYIETLESHVQELEKLLEHYKTREADLERALKMCAGMRAIDIEENEALEEKMQELEKANASLSDMNAGLVAACDSMTLDIATLSDK